MSMICLFKITEKHMAEMKKRPDTHTLKWKLPRPRLEQPETASMREPPVGGGVNGRCALGKARAHGQSHRAALAVMHTACRVAANVRAPN